MIEIKPVQDWNTVKSILKTNPEQNVFAMAAHDGGELLAAGAVALYEEYAELLEVTVPEQCAQPLGATPPERCAQPLGATPPERCQALNLAYGMGKSLLNFIDRRGIVHVVCDDDALEPLLRRLRFKKTDKVDEIDKHYAEAGIYYLNLTNYFTNHC